MEKHTGHINDRAGNAVAGASVRIVKPDGSEAALYASSGGPAIPNPLLTDADGRYAFAAANGKYSAQVSFNGTLYATIDGLVLFDKDDEQYEAPQSSGAGALDELGTANGATHVWGAWFGNQVAPLSDLSLPGGSGLIAHRNTSIALALDAISRPPAASIPAANGEMTFEATSDTQVTIRLKGQDGTVRSTVLTLA